jgi:hypothetical protein
MTLLRARSLDLGRVVERSDYWRRSPASVGGSAGHKEWSYFCVLGDQVHLVAAFSIMDRVPSCGGRGGVEVARVAMLARSDDGRWNGDVELCDPRSVKIDAGRVHARFGRSKMAFEGGTYQLRMAFENTPLAARLALQPIARPAVTRSVPLGPTDPMQWFVVPRLSATGEVAIGSRVHQLRGCPAYHDHNWGRFAWGDDFAWEWGIALASGAQAWSLIYYRITDRARHTVVSQGLLLWRDDRHRKTFRDGDLAMRSRGVLRTAGCLRLPRIMHLAVPGSANDIPTSLDVAARNGADGIDVHFAMQDCAQIGLPHDTDDGITIITECAARVSAAGRVDGSAVQLDCRAVMEFNRGAA